MPVVNEPGVDVGTVEVPTVDPLPIDVRVRQAWANLWRTVWHDVPGAVHEIWQQINSPWV